MPDIIERGDIYFFYRLRPGVQVPERLADIARVFTILVPDGEEHARLLHVGDERLPDDGGWMETVIAAKPHDIGEGLGPIEGDGGRQREAIPAAEGRYVLYAEEGTSYLAYRIVEPEELGPAQRHLGIVQAAGYAVALRSEAVEGGLEIADPRLLDHPHGLIGLVRAYLGCGPVADELEGKPDLFEKLGLDRKVWPVETLYEGLFEEAPA